MLKMFRAIPFSFPEPPHCRFSITCFSSSSSPTAAATPSPSVLVNYLIDSLGFHEDEAVAVSSEVPRLKSTANSDLVVNAFKDYGLDSVQIKNIVSIVPRILTIKPSKTLEPKLRVFRELGLPAPDLVTLVRKNRFIFWKGLHTQIIPTVDYFRKLLRCDRKVVKVINRSKWMLLTDTTVRRISENISSLKTYGVSDERILMFFVANPQRMKQTPELVESKLQYLEGQLGISGRSSAFIHGLSAVMHRSESEIEKNRQVFRRFGWSDGEITALLRAQPYCLNKSEAYISDKLKFFMEELNYSPAYLIGCTSFWTLSLEKRLKPRNEIFTILRKRELVKDAVPLITIANYPESKFLSFLNRFESHIPGLCETYTNQKCKISLIA